MKKFYIITNEDRDPNLSVTRSIQDYIMAKGGLSSFYLSNKKKWAERTPQSLVSQRVDADAILVLGGDGTLVRAARDMAKTGIPLIGVNLGTLGYLCELDKSTVFSAIDQLFEDHYVVEDRMMIEGRDLSVTKKHDKTVSETIAEKTVDAMDLSVNTMPEKKKNTIRENQMETAHAVQDKYTEENHLLDGNISMDNQNGEDAVPALNDIVVHRSGSTQMMNLVLKVNGEYLTTYCGDGVIISTPTGSTGYSMSAGGPIMDPKTKLLLITPINPQSFSSRSIVVGAEAEIEIMLAKRRPEQDEWAEVSFDGDHSISMKIGDRLLVKKADVSAKIMKLNQLSFLQILRKKMQEYR